MSSGPFKRFRLLPDFLLDTFVKQMWGPSEQICDFVESAEKSQKLVEWSRIKFESDQTFAQVLFDFYSTFANICSTFVKGMSGKS